MPKKSEPVRVNSILLSIALLSASWVGCAAPGVNIGRTDWNHATTPNQYGWDNTNCAHIMADGHCAHPTGANGLDIQSADPSPATPANCAHITADGTCAHPL